MLDFGAIHLVWIIRRIHEPIITVASNAIFSITANRCFLISLNFFVVLYFQPVFDRFIYYVLYYVAVFSKAFLSGPSISMSAFYFSWCKYEFLIGFCPSIAPSTKQSDAIPRRDVLSKFLFILLAPFVIRLLTGCLSLSRRNRAVSSIPWGSYTIPRPRTARPRDLNGFRTDRAVDRRGVLGHVSNRRWIDGIRTANDTLVRLRMVYVDVQADQRARVRLPRELREPSPRWYVPRTRYMALIYIYI